MHFDVDTVDGDEIVLGLSAVPDGLTSSQVRRTVANITAATDIVGLVMLGSLARPADCTQ